MSRDRNAYMREYFKRRYDQRMAQARERLGGKCVDCGSTDNLQFDHIEPKYGNVSDFYLLSQAMFDDEVSRCVLRCKSCHEAKHWKGKVTHGTLTSYRYCKCDECKKAKADWNRAYKQRTRTSVVEDGAHNASVVGSIPTESTA